MVLLGLVVSLWSASRRWKTETRNRSVEITLDYSELRTLAAAEGLPIADVLHRFHEAGATSVALDEDTIGGLEGARRLQVLPSPDRSTSVLRLGPDLYNRVSRALAAKTRYTVQSAPAPDGGGVLTVAQSYGLVRGVGVGIDRGVAVGIRKAGLGIVGRVGNYIGVDSAGIAATLDQLHEAGASTVIFLGDDVLGNKGLIRPEKIPTGNKAVVSAAAPLTTQTVLERDTLNYGTVEFGKQKGDADLVLALPERTVRVHTVPGAEMAQADIPSNIQRFLLAARERNIRLLFVRLFLSEADPLNKNTDYIQQIHDGLSRTRLIPGLTTGTAHGYPDLTTPLWVRAVICGGLAAAWLLLCDAVTGLLGSDGGSLTRIATYGGALLLVLLPFAPGHKGPQIAALVAACLYPALALIGTDLLRPGSGTGYSPLKIALLRFLRACAVTSVGIAAIIGLLADRLFLIKAGDNVFLGVKATLVVPVLLVTLVYALDLRANARRPWARTVEKATALIERFAREPILFWQAAAGFAALVALAFLVMRSGNDPGVGVSGTELKVRSLLDAYLPARPRFKDIFGHPALILALALAAQGRRKWAIPLLIIGAIGQASLLNTFCHLHTPIPVSLSRALLGIVFGVIMGIVLYALLDRLVLRHLEPARVEPTELLEADHAASGH